MSVNLANWYDDNPIIFYWKTRKDFIMEQTMTAQEIVDLLKANTNSTGTIFLEELPVVFSVEDEGDWIANHKYEYRESVVKHIPTGTFFMLTDARSGSYYTDWYYEPTDINQVVPRIIEQRIWVAA